MYRMKEFESVSKITLGDWIERDRVEVSIYGYDQGIGKILGLAGTTSGDIFKSTTLLEELMLSIEHDDKPTVRRNLKISTFVQRLQGFTISKRDLSISFNPSILLNIDQFVQIFEL